MKKFLISIAVFLLYQAPLPAQETLQSETIKTDQQLTLDDLRTFTDVFNQLRSNFVIEVDDHTLLTAAIDGMISELDPWSAFLNADQSQNQDNAARGRYAGIGISIDVRDGRIFVDQVSPDGPAAAAGVKPGDIVTSVEGRRVRGRRISASVDALAGDVGTVVTVRFKTGHEPARELRLTREYIPVSSVSSQLLDHRIGYFKVTHFHRNTHLELENSIRAIQTEAADTLNGIIIDLRGNPGGVVLPAVEMADGFLDEGMIVYTQGRYEASLLEFRAHPGQWVTDVPLAILVDRQTASAAEVFTGALQDHGRAIVIGEKTFGKGSIQSIFRLRNGSMLKLTTAHYFTPLGRTIHNNGIVPDIIKEPASNMLEFVTPLENDSLIHEALSQLGSMDKG